MTASAMETNTLSSTESLISPADCTELQRLIAVPLISSANGTGVVCGELSTSGEGFALAASAAAAAAAAACSASCAKASIIPISSNVASRRERKFFASAMSSLLSLAIKCSLLSNSGKRVPPATSPITSAGPFFAVVPAKVDWREKTPRARRADMAPAPTFICEASPFATERIASDACAAEAGSAYIGMTPGAAKTKPPDGEDGGGGAAF
mmetsp:Transcript_13900/g.37991  ORF Transcript_13900/g.37991 Transcript_13900/m.37991 type:complete len:210 (-) Transcript_13900:314-943(-)